MTLSSPSILHAQLSVVPQEMKVSSVTLVLDLATETTHMADESGEGVASTAAFAVVEIIGQVRGLSFRFPPFGPPVPQNFGVYI